VRNKEILTIQGPHERPCTSTEPDWYPGGWHDWFSWCLRFIYLEREMAGPELSEGTEVGQHFLTCLYQ